MNNIEKILFDISSYYDITIEQLIENRLDKILLCYIKEIDSAYERLGGSNDTK